MTLSLDMELVRVLGWLGLGPKPGFDAGLGVLMSRLDAKAGARLVSWADSGSERC